MLGHVLHDPEVALHGVRHSGDEAELGDQDDLNGLGQVRPLELEWKAKVLTMDLNKERLNQASLLEVDQISARPKFQYRESNQIVGCFEQYDQLDSEL